MRNMQANMQNNMQTHMETNYSTFDPFEPQPPDEPPSGARATSSNEEIVRLARALDNYVSWLDRRREWRENEAARRRAKRRQQQEVA
jgi:hypothetical protein